MLPAIHENCSKKTQLDDCAFFTDPTTYGAVDSLETRCRKVYEESELALDESDRVFHLTKRMAAHGTDREDAWLEFYLTAQPQLYSIVRRIVRSRKLPLDDDKIDDVVSESMADFDQQLPAIIANRLPGQNPLHLLITIASRRVLGEARTVGRRRRRESEIDDDSATPLHEMPAPHVLTEKEDLAQSEPLHTLSERKRKIVLDAYNGETAKEIANELSSTPEQISQELMDALSELRIAHRGKILSPGHLIFTRDQFEKELNTMTDTRKGTFWPIRSRIIHLRLVEKKNSKEIVEILRSENPKITDAIVNNRIFEVMEHFREKWDYETLRAGNIRVLPNISDWAAGGPSLMLKSGIVPTSRFEQALRKIPSVQQQRLLRFLLNEGLAVVDASRRDAASTTTLNTAMDNLNKILTRDWGYPPGLKSSDLVVVPDAAIPFYNGDR